MEDATANDSDLWCYFWRILLCSCRTGAIYTNGPKQRQGNG